MNDRLDPAFLRRRAAASPRDEDGGALPSTLAATGLRVLDCWRELMPPAARTTLDALHGLLAMTGRPLQPTVRFGTIVYQAQRRGVVSIAVHRRSVHLQALWRGAPPGWPVEAHAEDDRRRCPASWALEPGRRCAGTSPRLGADPRIIVVRHGRMPTDVQQRAIVATLRRVAPTRP